MSENSFQKLKNWKLWLHYVVGGVALFLIFTRTSLSWPSNYTELAVYILVYVAVDRTVHFIEEDILKWKL